MKKYSQLIKSIATLAVLALIIVVVNYVGAAGPYQANPIPGGYTTPNLLFTNNVSQAKSGNLALGAGAPGYTPQSALDVKGTVITDLLGVLNGGLVTTRLKVGPTAPATTGSQLVVESSRIRSEILAGTGERTICADADGRLKICAAVVIPPVNGVCGAANGVTVSVAPTTSLCQTGTASAVTGNGPWSWTCSGSNGGTNATCSAPLSSTPPTPYNGACGAGTFTCSQGTVANTQTTYTPFPNNYPGGGVQARSSTWTCLGSNSGINTDDASCSSAPYCPSGYEMVGCFTAGTQVTMADGTKKSIEDIKPGETIFAAGDNENDVKEVLVHNYQGWVYGINGSEPFVTGVHPMMTTEGWKSFEPEKTAVAEPDVVIVGKLKVGDILIKEGGEKETIKTTSRVWKTIPVYNLSVSGTHEYYADGYQVHNKSTNPYCVVPTTPAGNTPVAFCDNYPITTSCSYQPYAGCSGPGQACWQAVCSNIPMNSISNLSSYYNQTALNGWGYDPANATYYLGSGSAVDAFVSGVPVNGLMTVGCRSTIP